jgi:hypothetical protein
MFGANGWSNAQLSAVSSQFWLGKKAILDFDGTDLSDTPSR